MANKGNCNLEWVDWPAFRIRIGERSGFVGPRLQIFLAVCFLIVALSGLIIAITGKELGSDLVFIAMIFGLAMRVVNDWQKRGARSLDERERAIMWKSNAWGAIVPLAIVIGYTLLLSNFADDGWWFPQQDFQWSAISLALVAAWGLISLIANGVMTPVYAAELDEDD